MTSKANKGVVGYVINGKYYSMKVPQGISLNNENTLVAKESIKNRICEELKGLAKCSDIIVKLAKIASLTSLYLDLDKGADSDIPFILVNSVNGNILVTNETPNDLWVEAIEFPTSVKPDKKTN